MQFGGQPTPWSEVEIEGLRLRSVSQILIQEIGAAGPENAEDSARRACGVIQRQADQIVSADARIAELERNIERLDAQWREELRIYREADDARIAELESALLVERERICAAIKATDDAASACDYMLDSDDCIAVVRGELGPANYEDAARAGNGGGV